MKNIGLVVFILAILGCASSEKFISKEITPSASQGYIGGDFTSTRKIFVTAFLLVNQDTKQEYILPFTNSTAVEPGHHEVGFIQLPPGPYKISQWMVYNPGLGPGALAGREFVANIEPGKLSTPFIVKANQVVFLGKFSSSNQWTPGYNSSTTSGSWIAEHITNGEAKNVLRDAYPNLSSAEFKCTLCSD